MRILITGSRHWTDVDAIRRALRDATDIHPQAVTVVHGGAPGADSIADQVAYEYGCTIEVHTADWTRYGRAAGPVRNARMVSLGADLCLAFPLGESRGTRGCMALAAQAGIPITVVEAQQ